MVARTDSEATSAILFVLETIRCESAYHLPINPHAEILDALIDSFTLSRRERDLVAACCKVDCLADQACFLQKGDLCPLRSIGIVTGESTAISGNASPIAEGPTAPGGTVLISSVAQPRRFEASIGDRRIPCWYRRRCGCYCWGW